MIMARNAKVVEEEDDEEIDIINNSDSECEEISAKISEHEYTIITKDDEEIEQGVEVSPEHSSENDSDSERDRLWGHFEHDFDYIPILPEESKDFEPHPVDEMFADQQDSQAARRLIFSDSDSETEESFIVRELQEREYWETLERKAYEKQQEKIQQDQVNKWLHPQRRSPQQRQKELEYERFINTAIGGSISAQNGALKLCDIPQDSFLYSVFDSSRVAKDANKPKMGVSTRNTVKSQPARNGMDRTISKGTTLVTPGFRLLEGEDGYDDGPCRTFVEKYNEGYISAANWVSPELEWLRQCPQRKRGQPQSVKSQTRGKKVRKTLTDSDIGETLNVTPKNSKIKNGSTASAESPTIGASDSESIPGSGKKTKRTRIRMNEYAQLHFTSEWHDEEKKLFKEFFIAFGKDWKRISQLMYSSKNPTQVKGFYYETRLSLLDQCKERNCDQSDRLYGVQFGTEPICTLCRIVSIANARPKISHMEGDELPSSPVKKTLPSLEVGDEVFVQLSPDERMKLPRGGWFEGRITSKQQRKVWEYEVDIPGMPPTMQRWVTKEQLAFTLPVGSQVWKFVSEKRGNAGENLPRVNGKLHSEGNVKVLLDSLNPTDRRIKVNGNKSLPLPFPSPSIDKGTSADDGSFAFNSFRDFDLLNLSFGSIFSATLEETPDSRQATECHFDTLLTAVDCAVDILFSTWNLNDKSKQYATPMISTFKVENNGCSQPIVVAYKLLLARNELLLECSRCFRARAEVVSLEHRRNVETCADTQELLGKMQGSVDYLEQYRQMLLSQASAQFTVYCESLFE